MVNEEAASKDQSLVDLAYGAIKRNILDLSYPPGLPLTEARLSQELSMSRMPVRMALKRLQDEGWLIAGFRKKVRVKEITRSDIVDIYQLRSLLERPALRLIFERQKTWEYSFIVEEKLLRVKAARHDLYARERAETELHRAIVGVYGNTMIDRIYRHLQDEMVRIGLSFVAKRARGTSYIDDIIAGLDQLVLAIRENRMDQALEILDRDHLDGALKLALQYLDEGDGDGRVPGTD